jgi:hypothetical protein
MLQEERVLHAMCGPTPLLACCCMSTLEQHSGRAVAHTAAGVCRVRPCCRQRHAEGARLPLLQGAVLQGGELRRAAPRVHPGGGGGDRQPCDRGVRGVPHHAAAGRPQDAGGQQEGAPAAAPVRGAPPAPLLSKQKQGPARACARLASGRRRFGGQPPVQLWGGPPGCRCARCVLPQRWSGLGGCSGAPGRDARVRSTPSRVPRMPW